jgi:hypothetical protein
MPQMRGVLRRHRRSAVGQSCRRACTHHSPLALLCRVPRGITYWVSAAGAHPLTGAQRLPVLPTYPGDVRAASHQRARQQQTLVMPHTLRGAEIAHKIGVVVEVCGHSQLL